jgi:hypothetical protein
VFQTQGYEPAGGSPDDYPPRVGAGRRDVVEGHPRRRHQVRVGAKKSAPAVEFAVTPFV